MSSTNQEHSNSQRVLLTPLPWLRPPIENPSFQRRFYLENSNYFDLTMRDYSGQLDPFRYHFTPEGRLSNLSSSRRPFTAIIRTQNLIAAVSGVLEPSNPETTFAGNFINNSRDVDSSNEQLSAMGAFIGGEQGREYDRQKRERLARRAKRQASYERQRRSERIRKREFLEKRKREEKHSDGGECSGISNKKVFI